MRLVEGTDGTPHVETNILLLAVNGNTDPSIFAPTGRQQSSLQLLGGEKGQVWAVHGGKISYQAQDQFLGCLRLAMQAVSFLRCTKSLKSSALANAPSYCYSKGLCVQGI